MTFRPSTLAYVSNVRFASASDLEIESGLLGWLSFELDGSLRVQGCTLRRTQGGKLTVSYPARRDAVGRRHFILRPVCDRVRQHLEREIFRALGFDEALR